MSTNWITDYVDRSDFGGLFAEELGWNRPRPSGRTVQLEIETDILYFTEASTFEGVSVWVCPKIPNAKAQRACDKALQRESTERVVIFYDTDRQVWRWPQARDSNGAGTPRLVAHEHRVGKPNEALRQRLQFIKIGIDESDVSVPEVVRRLRRAFDSEKITKSFYSKFAEQHRELATSIKGIKETDTKKRPETRWYSSILLNRLMFIYFMQRKGFLADDYDYLRNRLERVKTLERPGSFYEFYKDFLLPLFHEGLGADSASRRIDDQVIRELIGEIPYVNGGIFSKHPLEQENDIRVPDIAFQRIFDFFDEWQWHLDDRPTGNPNEINPDVLGYIFEQFVNNREKIEAGDEVAIENSDKGAFYTKEDVTSYMTTNSLVPVFLDQLQSESGVNVWRVLAKDPQRYMWPSLQFGCDAPVPQQILDEQNQFPRPSWDSVEVPSDIGLPTESWWEVMDRRRTSGSLIASARAGLLDSSDAAIAANIDLESIAVDVLDGIDNPKDLVAAWNCLTSIRILDPTCGSGAFLFAALSLLHRMYSVILDNVQDHARTSKSPELSDLLQKVSVHPNRDYFVLKHAALNNLFGVDLMPEAVEIARLRLFLKLISYIEDRRDIQPLPDLEFSIQSGNALIGASNVDAIRARVDLLSQARVDEVVRLAEQAIEVFRNFVDIQQSGTHSDVVAAKQRVHSSTREVRSQLDTWWWESWRKNESLEEYKELANPLHWIVEFPGAMSNGGFDVVIGNPPYVPRKDVTYPIDELATRDLPDIYAPCLERSIGLLKRNGRLAIITPHSLMQSRNFKSLRAFVAANADAITCSSFARIPAGLFDSNVRVRNSILMCKRSQTGSTRLKSSRCRRWYSEFRPHVMALIKYTDIPIGGETWPFCEDERLLSAFSRLRNVCGGTLASDVIPTDPTGHKQTLYYKGNAYNYLSVAMEPVPVINADGTAGTTSQQREISFSSKRARDFAYVLLTGRIGLTWWAMLGDDFDLTAGIIETLPGSYSNSPKEFSDVVLRWAPKIARAQHQATVWKLNKGKRIGNWDLSACRHVTDIADLEILQAAGCTTDEIEAIWTAYERVFMSGTDNEA